LCLEPHRSERARSGGKGTVGHQLIILGPQGSGKSTQAKRLAERLGIARVSVGELLRSIAATDSGQQIGDILASGNLAPDALVEQLVHEQLAALPREAGFVLEGYPRNAAQAEALHRILARLGRLSPRPVVVWLDVPRGEALQRLHGRRDLDGRADDAGPTIAQRLEIHDTHASQVRDALSDWADVVTVSGNQPPEAVTEEILQRLDGGIPCLRQGAP
jgi:adenylate kinase